MSMDLLMAQIGAIESASRLQLIWWLRPGRTVTRVDWRGCMATDRHVEKTGKLVLRRSQKLIGGGDKTFEGIDVDYGGQVQWESLDRVRFVGTKHDVEVWS